MQTMKAKRTTESNRNGRSLTAEDIADAAWQPWFLPQAVAHKITQIVPPGYRKRFRFYFDDFGCLACGRKDRPYRSLGFCEVCHSKITIRMRHTLKRHRRELGVAGTTPRVRWYIEQVDRAQELLAEFVPHKGKSRNQALLADDKKDLARRGRGYSSVSA